VHLESPRESVPYINSNENCDKTGLRAKEIAALTWSMVIDAEGHVADVLHLENRATKGKTGGRSIPLYPQLRTALAALHQARQAELEPWHPVIFSERGRGLTADTVQLWFHRLYTSLGFAGCSSHYGRRTIITRAARKVSEAGGSLRDVQQLAGHASLAMTQRYIEGDSDAKRKLIQLI
jgi:integrase/recombinase XerC